VQFNEQAFDALVMTPKRKKLIQALAKSHASKRSVDFIAGKGVGSMFLLHGPPGVGKTLKTEAISEMLHKPLYVWSAWENWELSKQLNHPLRWQTVIANIQYRPSPFCCSKSVLLVLL
jgi:replication-associated recombination protein RarA